MIPLGTSVNIIDDKYLSAKSGRTTTIVFPAYSSCSANLTAAAAAAPAAKKESDNDADFEQKKIADEQKPADQTTTNQKDKEQV